MKVGIMQPYFFPYIGYFQLLNLVDRYVIYDNIQYTKKGWINRNRILQNGTDVYITIPLVKDSDYLDVKDRVISDAFDKKKLLAQLSGSYRKAPFYKENFPILEEIINYENNNLFEYILNSVLKLCEFLDIKTEIIISSNLSIDHTLKGQDKVIEICKTIGATDYYNAIGGLELYNKEAFKKEEINLHFIKTQYIEYKQLDNEFVPYLSIIDVMMFNSSEDIIAMLNKYELQ